MHYLLLGQKYRCIFLATLLIPPNVYNVFLKMQKSNTKIIEKKLFAPNYNWSHVIYEKLLKIGESMPISSAVCFGGTTINAKFLLKN